jgi:hypothetical protein
VAVPLIFSLRAFSRRGRRGRSRGWFRLQRTESQRYFLPVMSMQTSFFPNSF